MKTTMKFIAYSLMIFTLTLTSCSVEDGEDGLQGEQGIAGLDGDDGTDGEDGNANVIASDWIPSEFSTTATTRSIFEIEDPALTVDIADTAVIYAYARAGSNDVISIPFTFSNRSYYFAVIPTQNVLRIIAGSVDGSQEFFNIDFNAVRYVIVPASTSASETSKQASIDYSDYNAVKEAYNLKD